MFVAGLVGLAGTSDSLILIIMQAQRGMSGRAVVCFAVAVRSP